MPEIKNTFINSRMNKDLDARLLPNGEYRDAMNVSISKSESADVGALENSLGNIDLATFYPDDCNVDIIGKYMDVVNDRIIVFMTNFSDSTSDKLSGYPTREAICAIGVYQMSGSAPISTIIVSGNFLNFSKTHHIYGVNVINELLFWTDDRNQPRKINLNTAIGDTSYYTNEDHISVAKYYPYQTIQVVKNQVTTNLAFAPGTGYTNGVAYPAVTTGGTGSGLTFLITVVLGAVQALPVILNPGTGYTPGDTVTISGGNNDSTYQLDTTLISGMQDVVSPLLPDDATANPLLNTNWPGDPNYLKDKFVRFSYRFKFDDGEYSLIAPFTQDCFIPEQDGYFIGDDETISYKSTEVAFMQNKVNNILLIIPSPSSNGWDSVVSEFKISEIDIIYKQSNESALKVVESIPVSIFAAQSGTELEYNYQSLKPWKTLPTKDLLRVYDQTPVRALAQEVVGNRVVYGNFVDKPTPPTSLSYYTKASIKNAEGVLDPEGKPYSSRKGYQNHTLKQNRTYQVGIVLCDRYGRQSNVILSNLTTSKSAADKASTLFHPFKGTDPTAFSAYPTGSLITPATTWPGDSLKVIFEQTISSIKNSTTGTPGLYNGDSTSTSYNPLGWYTYKVVVKQTEQDYYNVYFPGILQGYIDGEAKTPTDGGASVNEPISHFALSGDNINKIPRDLSLVGPNQTFFRTGRPSVSEDPSYYEGVDSSGIPFLLDPYNPDDEVILKQKDRERDLDSGSQINNTSVKLSPRVVNYSDVATKQSYPGVLLDSVVTIGTGTELGLWDPSAIPPFNIAPVFYGYKNNPYIAKVEISDWSNSDKASTGVEGPGPDAGSLSFSITSLNLGTLYTDEDRNVPCKPPSEQPGYGSGFKVNITEVTAGSPDSVTIATIGKGWDPSVFAVGDTPIGGYAINGGGDGACTFTLTVTKTLTGAAGQMQPIFTVHETQPIESKLDLYWESSTMGVISTLNEKITSGDIYTPMGFCDAYGNPLVFRTNESDAISTPIVWGNEIYVMNQAGSVLSAIVNTGMYFTVYDGTGSNRVGEFKWGPIGSNKFEIQNNGYFYYGNDAHTTNKETFDFAINVTVPSATYSTDGSTITSLIPFGHWNGISLIPYDCALNNSVPTITSGPYGPGIALIEVGVAEPGLQFTAINGANILSGLQSQGITWTIASGNPAGNPLYFSDPYAATNAQLMTLTAFATTFITIRATDPGGLYNEISLQIEGTV